MNRIVAFGCSHTYGHGLEDCWTASGKPGKEPSKLVWPEILGNMNNVPVVNKSIPGGSVFSTSHSIEAFKFKQGDYVFILWPDYNRIGLVQTPVWPGGASPYYNLVPSMALDYHQTYKPEVELIYKKFHSEETSQFNFKALLNYTTQYLLNKGNRVYNLFLDNQHKKLLLPEYAFTCVANSNFTNFMKVQDKAKDGKHMGIEGNKVYAELINNFILYNIVYRPI